MQPTEKQKLIAKIIEDQAQFWQSTNDISSPTHGCDIDECIALHDEELTEYEQIQLKKMLNDSLQFIRCHA